MNKISSQKLIKSILEYYKAGNFSEVEKLSKNLIENFPEDSFGWKVFSLILKKKGKIYESLTAGKKALKLMPTDAEIYYNLGNTYKVLTKLDEAIIHYEKAIELNSNYIDAYNNLAITLREIGSLDKTVNTYKKLISINPNYAEAYNNLGVALKDLNKLNEAQNSYKKAIELKPNYAEAYNNLGITLRDLKIFNEAIICSKKAIELKANYAEAYNNLGVSYRKIGDLIKSKDNYLKAIKIESSYALAYYNLGVTLRELGKLNEAESNYKKAIELKPNYAEAYNNLGIVLSELGKLDSSEKNFKKAIKLKPDYADAYNNLSLTLLLKKNFKEAFELNEWRWRTENQNKIISSKPLWNGKKNSRIFIWKEQGIGDEIMFCSILPEVTAQSKKLILNCDERLIPLFKRSLSGEIVYEIQKKKIKEIDYDYHISMGSLRRLFRKDLKSFKKSSTGYLKGNSKQILEFKNKLNVSKGFKFIGLSWGSKAKDQMAFFKTIALKDLAVKLYNSNIKFVNLQYGDSSDQINDLKKEKGIEIIDIPEIDKTNDIDSLASLLCACDVVISIDNFLVQLSGSLGVDTRVLLSATTDSRWGFKDFNSYLYKSVRLYRQKKLGDWNEVLDKLNYDLNKKN